EVLLRNDLQRHDPLEVDLLRLVDRAHSPAADALEELVTPHALADQGIFADIVGKERVRRLADADQVARVEAGFARRVSVDESLVEALEIDEPESVGARLDLEVHPRRHRVLDLDIRGGVPAEDDRRLGGQRDRAALFVPFFDDQARHEDLTILSLTLRRGPYPRECAWRPPRWPPRNRPSSPSKAPRRRRRPPIPGASGNRDAPTPADPPGPSSSSRRLRDGAWPISRPPPRRRPPGDENPP